MGHRAIVVYERRDRPHVVRYSQWGALDYRLLESITYRTPLGRRPAPSPKPSTASGLLRASRPLVEHEPLGAARDLATVARRFVDPIVHEAVYVVSPRYDVALHHPLHLARGAVDRPRVDTASGGALVDVPRDRRPARFVAELRAWTRGLNSPDAIDERVDGVGESADGVADSPDPAESSTGCRDSRTGDAVRVDDPSSWFEHRLAALEAEHPGRRIYPIPPGTRRREGVTRDAGSGIGVS